MDGNLSGLKVNDDCSSFVTACLIQGGILEQNTRMFNSADYQEGKEAAQALIDAGFVWYSAADIGENNLQLGDIMVRVGHVQIFESYDDKVGNTRISAYSWGNIYGSEPVRTCTPNTFVTDYLGIWRLEY